MACPYFSPFEPLPERETAGRPRPPLGEFHDGECACTGSSAAPIPLPLELCNMGYARGQACFSSEAPVDAVRFSIAGDDGRTVLLRYCLERDHLPVEWGEISWNRASQGFSRSLGKAILERQMLAYVASYLRAVQQGPKG